MVYSNALNHKILEYYRAYYQSCGLANSERLAEARLVEETREELRLVWLQTAIGFAFRSGQKHCDIGSGTGGTVIVLYSRYQCDVYGIEPNDTAFDILKDKCNQHGIDANNFRNESAEHISFPDSFFDVVHCSTVLEHVQDVKKSISEMIRICKPGGLVYVNTPNYLFPREGHYKVVAPTFFGKGLTKIWLALLGRPTAFLQDINFLTPRVLNRMLSKHSVTWSRVYTPYQSSVDVRNIFGRIEDKLFQCARWIGIYPNQDIIIRKTPSVEL